MLSKLQNKNYRAYFKDIVTSNGSRFDSDRLKLTVEKKTDKDILRIRMSK